MIPEKMMPRPGNRSRASAYAAIEWKNNATTVTTTATKALFSRKRGNGIFSSTYCKLSSVQVEGQPKENTSSAGFSTLISTHTKGATASKARTWARIGKNLLLIETTSSGEGEHQAGAEDQQADHDGGQRGGVAHVVEGEGLLVDVEHHRAGGPGRTTFGQHVDQVERLQPGDSSDGRVHHHEEAGRAEQRPDHEPEPLPRAGSVDLGRILEFLRYVLQPGEEDQHLVAHQEPHADHDIGAEREGRRTEEREVAKAQRRQQFGDGAALVHQQELPDQADHDQADDVRQEEGRADPADAPEGDADQHRE